MVTSRNGKMVKRTTPIEAAKKAGIYHPDDSAKLIRKMYGIFNKDPSTKNAILISWAKKVHRGVKEMESQCKIY